MAAIAICGLLYGCIYRLRASRGISCVAPWRSGEISD